MTVLPTEHLNDFRDKLAGLNARLKSDKDVREQFEACPACSQLLFDIKVTLKPIMLQRMVELMETYKDDDQGSINFRPQDVREYDNVCYLDMYRFGLGIFRTDHEEYNEDTDNSMSRFGMNRRHVLSLFNGRPVHHYYMRNKLTKDIEMSPDEVSIFSIPRIKNFLYARFPDLDRMIYSWEESLSKISNF